MACTGISKILIVGLVLLFFAFFCDIIGLAPPYWIYSSVTSGSVTAKSYQGLWQACTETDATGTNVRTCNSNVDSDNPSWFKACQAMSILAFIMLIAATGLVILKMFVTKTSKPVLIGAIINTLLAAILLLCVVAVYGGETEDIISASSSLGLNFAFAFTVIASFVSLIAGIVLVIDLVKGPSAVDTKA